MDIAGALGTEEREGGGTLTHVGAQAWSRRGGTFTFAWAGRGVWVGRRARARWHPHPRVGGVEWLSRWVGTRDMACRYVSKVMLSRKIKTYHRPMAASWYTVQPTCHESGQHLESCDNSNLRVSTTRPVLCPLHMPGHSPHPPRIGSPHPTLVPCSIADSLPDTLTPCLAHNLKSREGIILIIASAQCPGPCTEPPDEAGER